MSRTETLQLTDCELLDSLRCFPRDVLPVGVLRELIQRGPKIQDEVLRRLDKAVSHAGIGIGCIPLECFYCFGLLIAHPCVEQLPTLERLLRLDRDILDRLASDLSHNVPWILIVEIARVDGPTDVIAWLDRMLHDDSIGEWSAGLLVTALPYLVRDEIIPREQAIDRLIGVLRRRESHTYDLLSAFALIELSNLGATELDAFVNECFDRDQIDDDLYGRADWQRECGELTTPESRLEGLREPELDLLEQIQPWHCFSEVSHSLNPFEATFEPNPDRLQDRCGSSLTASEIDLHFQSLRTSNDQRFPRAAVEALERNAEQVKERLIEEVRDGLGKAGGPDARCSNGPFLALALLIARGVKIPRDLLLSIVDLPEDQRMDLFGDAMDHAVTIAISLSLQGDTAPIDARIIDSGRSEIDRSVLARFYPLSSWRGHVTREDAIERLFRFWHSSLSDECGQSGMVSDSLLEALCMMSPQQHRDALLQTIEQQDGSAHFSQQQLRKMMEDPSQGVDQVLAWYKETRDVMKLIGASVMFDKASLQPEKSSPIDIAPPQLAGGTLTTTTTVRNTTSSPRRNDACPYGSGKKYKKCCLRK